MLLLMIEIYLLYVVLINVLIVYIMMIDENHVELLIMIMDAKDLDNVLLYVKHVEHNLTDVNVFYLDLLLIGLIIMN